jgi:hypothetical protein
MNHLLSFLSFSLNEEADPKVGTGKKPKVLKEDFIQMKILMTQ